MFGSVRSSQLRWKRAANQALVGLGVGRLDEMPLPRVGGRLPVAALGFERLPLLFPFFLAQGAQRPFRREVLAGAYQDPGSQTIRVHVIGDGQETDVPQPGDPVMAGGETYGRGTGYFTR